MSRSTTGTIGRLLFCLILLATNSFNRCTALCYYPDGIHVAPQDVPCNGGSSDSVCCGPGYACLSNKICMRNNQTLDDHSSQLYVRGSCTDKKWLSASCPSFCTANQDGGEGMKKCENSETDSYCCLQGSKGTSKCDKGPVIIRFQGQPSAITTIGVTATSSLAMSTGLGNRTEVNGATQSASESRPVSSSSAVEEARAQSSSSGWKIGIGVGVPLGVLAVTLGTYLIWRKTRQAKLAAASPDNNIVDHEIDKDNGRPGEHRSSTNQMEPFLRHELDWNNYTRELPVEENLRHEAGASTP